MKNNAIPILYYHSVADHDKNRPWSFLSCGIDVFKTQMEYLSKNDFYTCTWDELYRHLNGIEKLPEKTVMIHFDDGFLDNWTVVFPIMKKYNLKFSIVVTPEFIEKSEKIRDFVKETKESNIKDWWGYLSIGELREMEDSGLVDIQAHGYTHTWYPVSDEIIDIYDGTQIEPWLYWNEFPEKKPFWLTNNSLKKIPLGTPIFKNEKSLSNLKAFKPNKKFIQECIDAYNKDLSKEENFKRILEIRKKYLANNELGEYESEKEARERLEKELLGTKKYLTDILNKEIEYLVWPGGGNNEFVNNLAFEYGYKLVSKGNELNKYDSKIKKISRLAAYHKFPIFDKYFNKLFFQLQIKRGEGNKAIGTLFNFVKKVKK